MISLKKFIAEGAKSIIGHYTITILRCGKTVAVSMRWVQRSRDIPISLAGKVDLSLVNQ